MTCCRKAQEAVNAGAWSTATPVVSELIGSVDPPEDGVPVYCFMAPINCVNRTDPKEKEACTKIMNDLDACTTQSCATGPWNDYADACEGEAGVE